MDYARLLVGPSWALALVAAMFSLSACNGTVPPEGVKLLQEAGQAYDAGDNQTTIARTGQFLANYGGTTAVGEAYYLRGLAKARTRDRRGAQADFEQAVQHVRRSDLLPLAQVSLGNLMFEQWQLAPAARYYEQAVEALPNKSPKDVVLYRLGQCYARQGQWRSAKSWFSQVMHLFRDSPMEPSARRHFAADGYRIQCGAFSDYANAARQVSYLRQRNLPAEQRLDVNGRFHLVQVGQYAGYDEARDALGRVLPVVPNAIIVP